MTSMTLNIDGTTLTLDEAITELRNLAYEIKYRTYNFQNGAGSREFVALQFAMRVLAEKAEVSPARRTDPATSHRAAPRRSRPGPPGRRSCSPPNGWVDAPCRPATSPPAPTSSTSGPPGSG